MILAREHRNEKAPRSPGLFSPSRFLSLAFVQASHDELGPECASRILEFRILTPCCQAIIHESFFPEVLSELHRILSRPKLVNQVRERSIDRVDTHA
jgi:hypothetical protein